MYAPEVVEKRLKKICAAKKFEVEYHSIKQVEEANGHFIECSRKEGFNPSTDLDQEEKNWIRNEHAISMCDYRYYATRYAHIVDWQGRLSRFVPNIAQSIKMDIRAEMEREGRSIEMMSLKARQLGISTEDEICSGHRVQFYSHVNAVIGSSDPKKSAKMSKMMEVNWDNMIWFLMPERTVWKAGELFEFGYQNSAVSIQHGSQFTGIARGSTATVVHLCVSGEELILVQNGILKRIKEVLPGDMVLTSDGTFSPVRAAARSLRNDRGVTVKLWTLPNRLHCTNDHLVLTDLGYAEAEKLKRDDFVIYPVRRITNNFRSTEMKVSETNRYRLQKNASITGTSVKFDRAFGRVCGLYLAEGSIKITTHAKTKKNWTSGVVISMHEREREAFTKILSEGLPLKKNAIRYGKNKNSKTAFLSVYSAHIGCFMGSNFGRKSEKRIPDWIWDAGRDFCVGLIEGYLLGDGHIPSDKMEIPASSICSGITFQLQRLIASCGFGWTSIYWHKGGNRYGRKCHEQWTINIAGETCWKIRKEFGWKLPKARHGMNRRSWRRAHWMWVSGGNIGVQVYRVERADVAEYWDLEIDSPTHNFVTIHGCIHNSELADFLDPEELVDASLLRAVHPSPWVLMDFESTAKGRHNWWHNTWIWSKENWESGRARLRPVFLPWFIGSDIYPTATWIRTHPVPDAWQPPQIAVKHAEKAEAYVSVNRLLSKYLGKNWKMPIEQIWYWDCTRAEAAAKKETSKFYQETAGSDTECFQNDTTSVFDVEVITSYRENCPEPKGVFGIIGPQSQIPIRLWPDRKEIDDSHPRIEIVANWSSTGKPLQYEMVPLKFNGYSEFDPDKKFIVWEWPEDNEEYGYGMDTAEGIGLDRTAIEVVRKGNLEKNDKQMAEFVSHWVSAFDAWPYCMAIGTLYSTMINGRLKQARSVIECRSNGENAQLELKKRGWRNFHPWLRYDQKKLRVDKAHRMGWFTNSWSRDMLTDQLIKALRDGWIDVCSPWFVDEMADFQKDENAQSLRAVYGGHDDRIMALGMVFLSLHILEVRGSGKSIIEQRMERISGSEDEEQYDPGAQGRDMDLDSVGRKSVRIGARY